MKPNNRSLSQVLALLSLVVLCGGCGDPLVDVQAIEKPRILGARLVSADNSSALILEAETEIELLIADPGGVRTARLAYQFCEAADSMRGVPYCDGQILSEGEIDTATGPIFVRGEAGLAAGRRLALIGVACLESEPLLTADPIDWACSGEDTALSLSFNTSVAANSVPNRNPNLAKASAQLADLPLDLDFQPGRAACTPEGPSAEREGEYKVTFVLGDDARETDEEVQVSHFSTRGLFERPFSFIEKDQPAELEVTWKAPSSAGAAQMLFVVRDGRGGVSWLGTDVCVN